MARYILRRALLLVATMLVTSFIIFFLTQLLPGDTARLILGREASEQAVEALREEFGLNDPFFTQYTNWLSRFVMGDWGRSLTSGNPEVRPLVLGRLENSLRLALMTFIISIPLSILLGVIAALRENSVIDSAISVLSLSVVGLPEFVTALVLINIFALQLDWLPATAQVPQNGTIGDWIRVLLLPALTATFVLLGYVSRMARAGVIEEIRKPYVRTATLKGLPRRQVIFKHVLRNALLPTITVVALSVGWLIGGLVVIENVFNYRGIGALLVEAVKQKNIPVLQAVVMMTIFFYALANFAADLIYALLNPRIRLQ